MSVGNLDLRSVRLLPETMFCFYWWLGLSYVNAGVVEHGSLLGRLIEAIEYF